VLRTGARENDSMREAESKSPFESQGWIVGGVHDPISAKSGDKDRKRRTQTRGLWMKKRVVGVFGVGKRQQGGPHPLELGDRSFFKL